MKEAVKYINRIMRRLELQEQTPHVLRHRANLLGIREMILEAMK